MKPTTICLVRKVERLAATLCQQTKEAARFDAAIEANLKEPGYGG